MKTRIVKYSIDRVTNQEQLGNITETNDDLEYQTLFFPNVGCISIPKKTLRVLQRHIPIKLLKTVDPVKSVAVEKCLMVLSYLIPTMFDDQWKSLSAENLRIALGFDYRRVIDLLLKGSEDKGPIIEVKKDINGIEIYTIKESTKQYKLTDTYSTVGLDEYILTDDTMIAQRNKLYYSNYKKALSNNIAINLINIYPDIELPTLEEVLAHGKALVKSGYITKKGKKLTMRNKHTNDYWVDCSNRSFVEDNIKLFSYLTKRGFGIPVEGGEKSGGRVTDSFTLMPSWIREMITIDGETLFEADYRALHPNIAKTIYSGSTSHISHQMIADELNLPLLEVKIEHLSFFNKRKEGMMKSPLFKYYAEKEPEMLLNILEDKNKWYKITSKRLFKAEVDIMTEVITRLNKEGVYTLYVYDALQCKKCDSALVTEVMNQVIQEFGVNTHVGDTQSIKEVVEPIVEEKVGKDAPIQVRRDIIKELIDSYEIIEIDVKYYFNKYMERDISDAQVKEYFEYEMGNNKIDKRK